MSAAFDRTCRPDRRLFWGSPPKPSAEECRKRIIGLWFELTARVARADSFGVLLSRKQLLTWGALYHRARLREGKPA